MKLSIFSVLAALSLVGCSSIRYVTLENGRIVTEHNKPVNIVGNPQICCFDSTGNVIAEGIFVYQRDDGAFLIDEYGKDYKIVKNPYCRLGSND